MKRILFFFVLLLFMNSAYAETKIFVNNKDVENGIEIKSGELVNLELRGDKKIGDFKVDTKSKLLRELIKNYMKEYNNELNDLEKFKNVKMSLKIPNLVPTGIYDVKLTVFYSDGSNEEINSKVKIISNSKITGRVLNFLMNRDVTARVYRMVKRN